MEDFAIAAFQRKNRSPGNSGSEWNSFEASLGVLELWNVFKRRIMEKFAEEEAEIEEA